MSTVIQLYSIYDHQSGLVAIIILSSVLPVLFGIYWQYPITVPSVSFVDPPIKYGLWSLSPCAFCFRKSYSVWESIITGRHPLWAVEKKLVVIINKWRVASKCTNTWVSSTEYHRESDAIKPLTRSVGRISNSDWFVNSFIWISFFLVQSEFLVQKTTKKNFLPDNHYSAIYEPVRIGYSSVRVN